MPVFPRLAVAAFWPSLFAAAPAPASPLPAPVAAEVEGAIRDGKLDDAATLLRYLARAYPGATAPLEERLSLAVASARLATAQVAAAAAPAQRVDSPASGFFGDWKGKGQLGGFLTTGDADSIGISAGLDMARRTDAWSLRLRANGDLQRTDGITAREQIVATIEPNITFSDGFYGFGLGQYEHDRQQGYAARYSVSGGLGYQIIDRETLRLAVKGGPALRFTRFDRGERETMVSALASTELEWKISDSVKLTSDGNLFIEDVRRTLAATTALDSKIFGPLSARLSWSIQHETDPQPGSVATDTISRASVVYAF